MQLLLTQLVERRFEIMVFDFLMHLALYLFTVVTMVIYIVAVLFDRAEIYKLIPLLLISLVVFVIMRGDFMIHRAGGYVRYVEHELPQNEIVDGNSGRPIVTWEMWKANRQNTWMVFLMDFVGGAVLLYVMFQAEVALIARQEYGFVLITTLVLVAAVVAIPKVVHVAAK